MILMMNNITPAFILNILYIVLYDYNEHKNEAGTIKTLWLFFLEEDYARMSKKSLPILWSNYMY